MAHETEHFLEQYIIFLKQYKTVMVAKSRPVHQSHVQFVTTLCLITTLGARIMYVSIRESPGPTSRACHARRPGRSWCRG